MKKILLISDNEKKSLLFRVAEKLFLNDSVYCSGTETMEVVNSQRPDYVLMDIIKPVNGDDMMSMLMQIDGNIRLRVAIFYIGYSKKHLFKLNRSYSSPFLKKAAK